MKLRISTSAVPVDTSFSCAKRHIDINAVAQSLVAGLTVLSSGCQAEASHDMQAFGVSIRVDCQVWGVNHYLSAFAFSVNSKLLPATFLKSTRCFSRSTIGSVRQ